MYKIARVNRESLSLALLLDAVEFHPSTIRLAVERQQPASQPGRGSSKGPCLRCISAIDRRPRSAAKVPSELFIHLWRLQAIQRQQQQQGK